ncbi:MAG: AIR synthase related protein [Prolixibacteraceae bacterium]
MAQDEIKEFDINQIPEPENISDVIYNLMVNPNLSLINYFNDFSESIPDPKGLNNDLSSEAGIIELEDGSKIVTMSTHALHHHLEQDPKKAAEILVTRAVRKMICFGATPIALTAMLYHINYSDPNGNFLASGAKAGLEEAAEAFGLKIADRKIRFDNFEEHDSQSPTLIISIMGTLKADKKKVVKTMDPNFKSKGNNIFLMGRTSDDIATSDYLEYYHGITSSPLPEFDLKFEVKLLKTVKELIEQNLVESAGPVGKGGLFFSLLRAGWANELGFDITTAAENRIDSFLFGESMGRIIVGVEPGFEEDFVDFVYDSKIPFFMLGHVTKGEIRIDDESLGYIDKMSTAV